MTAVREKPPSIKFDSSQFSRLVTDHQDDVWRYVRYLGATTDEADDLVQETFLSIARSGFEQRSQAETAAYIRTAARNQLLMLRRRQTRQPPSVDFDTAEAVWVAAHHDGATEPRLDALRDCVASLTGKAKEIIDFHYTQRLSRQESADRIGLSVEGVKTLLRRTRAALKQCIERRNEASQR